MFQVFKHEWILVDGEEVGVETPMTKPLTEKECKDVEFILRLYNYNLSVSFFIKPVE